MDHKSLVWPTRFQNMKGIMACWLHTIQQFNVTIVHHQRNYHSNADGLMWVGLAHLAGVSTSAGAADSEKNSHSTTLPSAVPWLQISYRPRQEKTGWPSW